MRRTTPRLKGKIYKAWVQNVLMYGGETLVIKVNDMWRWARIENIYLWEKY